MERLYDRPHVYSSGHRRCHECSLRSFCQYELPQDLSAMRRQAPSRETSDSNDVVLLARSHWSLYLRLDLLFRYSLDGTGNGRMASWVWIHLLVQFGKQLPWYVQERALYTGIMLTAL